MKKPIRKYKLLEIPFSSKSEFKQLVKFSIIQVMKPQITPKWFFRGEYNFTYKFFLFNVTVKRLDIKIVDLRATISILKKVVFSKIKIKNKWYRPLSRLLK